MQKRSIFDEELGEVTVMLKWVYKYLKLLFLKTVSVGSLLECMTPTITDTLLVLHYKAWIHSHLAGLKSSWIIVGYTQDKNTLLHPW